MLGSLFFKKIKLLFTNMFVLLQLYTLKLKWTNWAEQFLKNKVYLLQICKNNRLLFILKRKAIFLKTFLKLNLTMHLGFHRIIITIKWHLKSKQTNSEFISSKFHSISHGLIFWFYKLNPSNVIFLLELPRIHIYIPSESMKYSEFIIEK